MPPAARRTPWWFIAAALALAAGCTGSAGLDLAISIPAAARTTCVRAFADFGDGSQLSSQPIPREGRAELHVGLFETRGLSREARAGATGYYSRSGGCEAPLFPNEEAAPADTAFVSGQVVAVPLALQLPGGLDEDQDGFRAASGGGADCDDSRAAVSPVAQESCADGLDNDCSGAADCGDAACAGTGGCEMPEQSCADGLDNDGDRLADCSDSDCEGRTCSDGNPCTVNDRCSSGICTVAPVICASPPTPCFEPVGTCASDGGCVYRPDAGDACTGGFCAYDGSCGPLFRYAPANFTPPPIAMFAPPLRFDCGTSTFDSSPGASTPFANWCGEAIPPVIVVPQTGGPDAVLLPVRGLYVDSGDTLRFIGTRPVILAVFGDVRIDGTVTATAGGNSSACGTGAGGAGSASSSSGGGGGGGAFGGAGGSGGNSQAGAAGGLGGTANGTTTLVPLRGGCGGGPGGDSGGSGGGSGGGIQISASDDLLVRGRVAAPGSGGRGGENDQSGGGGGGSGGAILLEASWMSFTSGARVTVNGGGGGEGDNCCASGTWDGDDGDTGRTDGTGTASGGNTSGGVGGRGGSGGAGSTGAGDGSNGTSASTGGNTVRGGGGGGGGGVGRIRLDFQQGCFKDPAAVFSGAVTSSQPSDGGCP